MKIGIITMYYNSRNYGGLLQAYALCRYLNEHENCQAEQICYDSVNSQSADVILNRFKKASKKDKIKKIRRSIRGRVDSVLTKALIGKTVKKRGSSVKRFRDSIPHSNEVYTEKIIYKTNEIYDAYITGSDRVWKPDRIGNPYYLNFVKDKPKMSYAASLASNSLSEHQKAGFREMLKDYSTVSVREKETADILSEFMDSEIHWVVDPVFLLTADEWSQVSVTGDIEDKYLFCYFLGKDSRSRKIAKEYARKHGLKIVVIPYTNDKFYFSDLGFGDIRLNEASPERFVGLIRNAECIFTDSFHATVFSTIFKKQVYSFTRSDMKGGGTRLQSLTQMLGTGDRFIDTKNADINTIEEILPIDYEEVEKRLNERIGLSRMLLHKFTEKK